MPEFPQAESAEDTFEKNQETIKRVLESLRAKYPEQRDVIDTHPWIILWMNYLEKALGDLENIKGKRVLDIACGSLQPTEGPTYLPWFPRVVHELGAHAVGVDIGDLEGEPYEHYRVDLTKEDSLSFIPDHSCDIINMNSFVGIVPSRTLTNALQNNNLHVQDEIERIRAYIPKEMHRILKEGGTIMNHDSKI